MAHRKKTKTQPLKTETSRISHPAKVNLAMLYNRMGKKSEAENLLRDVVKTHPELYEIQYSPGLLPAEKEKYGEAAHYLAMAAKGIPRRARIHYNPGLLLSRLGRWREAEAALKRALAIYKRNWKFETG